MRTLVYYLWRPSISADSVDFLDLFNSKAYECNGCYCSCERQEEEWTDKKHLETQQLSKTWRDNAEKQSAVAKDKTCSPL